MVVVDRSQPLPQTRPDFPARPAPPSLATTVTDVPPRALGYLPITAFGLDAMIITFFVLLSIAARSRWGIVGGEAPVDEYISVFGCVTVALWLVMILIYRGYSRSVFVSGSEEYKRVIRATLLCFGILGVAGFMVEVPLARGFFAFSFTLGLPALIVGRFTLRRAVHHAHRYGQMLSRVLIAGSGEHIDEVAAVLKRESWLGYEIVGALTPTGTEGATPGGLKIIGVTDDMPWQVKTAQPDIVFFAGGAVDSARDLGRLAWELGKDGVQLVVAPSVSEVSRDRVRISPVGGLPLIHVDSPQASPFSRLAKRAFDIVGSSIAIVIFSPLMLALALWVRSADDGPALFRHTRVGRNSKDFGCLKFRTMVTNAEELLEELKESTGYTGGLFKMEDDPRITKPGKIMRRFSLDELPQFFNVLKGDMSLVGPRPQVTYEVEQYERHVVRRLDVQPGMTGLWQVSGRSDLPWDEAVRLDLYYVDNWSVLRDLSIIAKTVKVVLKSEGAY